MCEARAERERLKALQSSLNNEGNNVGENEDDEPIFSTTTTLGEFGKMLHVTLAKSTKLIEAVNEATKANTALILSHTAEREKASHDAGSSTSSKTTPTTPTNGSSSNDSGAASSKATVASYTIPKTQPVIPETQKHLEYKRDVYEALVELRILAKADLIRLNHHRDFMKQCIALGICPAALRIKSNNWLI